MVKFGQLYYHAQDILAQAFPDLEELSLIAAEAAEMDLAFSHWASSQMDIWKPVPLGSLSPETAVQSSYDFCHSGQVDDYYDRECALNSSQDGRKTLIQDDCRLRCWSLEHIPQIPHHAPRHDHEGCAHPLRPYPNL